MDETSSVNKKGKRPGVVVPYGELNVTQPPPNVISGITVCPCVAADGAHLRTALIFDEGFKLEFLNNYIPSDFKFNFLLYMSKCELFLFCFIGIILPKTDIIPMLFWKTIC